MGGRGKPLIPCGNLWIQKEKTQGTTADSGKETLPQKAGSIPERGPGPAQTLGGSEKGGPRPGSSAEKFLKLGQQKLERKETLEDQTPSAVGSRFHNTSITTTHEPRAGSTLDDSQSGGEDHARRMQAASLS